MTATCKNLLSVLPLLAFLVIASKGQPVVHIRDYNTLYLLDLKSGSESLLYPSEYPEIRSVKISPDGSLFAVLEIDHSGEYPVNHLRVLDAEGTLKFEARPDVRKYVWSPRSNRLAYITGTYYEGGRGFSPTGFFLQDFHLNEETAIVTDGFDPFELNWVSNPGEDALYVQSFSADQSKHFLKYDLFRSAFEALPFRSIDVSPDGSYYRQDDMECRCVKIFDRSTQKMQIRIDLSGSDIPVGWAYNQSHLYAVKKVSHHQKVRHVMIGDELKAATSNDGVKEGVIEVFDGANGALVQSVRGILPNIPPYQNMFATGDVLLSISVNATDRSGRANERIREQIAITTIPEKYR